MTRRLSTRSAIRVRAYDVVARAVEEGVGRGWRRAHKHADDPDAHALVNAIVEDVLSELSAVLEFEEGP